MDVATTDLSVLVLSHGRRLIKMFEVRFCFKKLKYVNFENSIFRKFVILLTSSPTPTPAPALRPRGGRQAYWDLGVNSTKK